MKSGKLAHLIAESITKQIAETSGSAVATDFDHQNRRLVTLSNGQKFEIIVRNCLDESRYTNNDESVVS